MNYNYEIIDSCGFEQYKYDNSLNYDKAREIWNDPKQQIEKKESFNKIKSLLDHIFSLNENDVEIEFLEEKVKDLREKLHIVVNESKIEDNSYGDIKEMEFNIDYFSILYSFSPIAGGLIKLSFNNDLDQFINRISSIFSKIRSYLYQKNSILPKFINDIKSCFINEKDVYISKASFQSILKRYSIQSSSVLSTQDIDILIKYLNIEDNQCVNILLFLNCILGNKEESFSKIPATIQKFKVSNERILYKYIRVEESQLREIKKLLNNSEEYDEYETALFEILKKIRKKYKRNIDKFWGDSYVIESSSSNPVGEFVYIKIYILMYSYFQKC